MKDGYEYFVNMRATVDTYVYTVLEVLDETETDRVTFTFQEVVDMFPERSIADAGMALLTLNSKAEKIFEVI